MATTVSRKSSLPQRVFASPFSLKMKLGAATMVQIALAASSQDLSVPGSAFVMRLER